MRNLRRGFNRIFVILWIAWAMYCIVVYPLQERSRAFDHYQSDLRFCHEFKPQDNDCLKLAKEEWETRVALWSIEKFRPRDWLLCALVIVVPPLIAYGLVWGTVGVFVWGVARLQTCEGR